MVAAMIPIIPEIRLRRLLFATDLSEANCATLPIISTIAHRYHSQVFVARVCSPWSFSMMSEPNTRLLIESREEDAARQKMTELLAKPEFAGLQTELLIKWGMPAEQIGRMVKECSIDLVVVNTHGRSGIKRFFAGSVAENLFRHVSCPVLTIGPHVALRFCQRREIESILYPTDLSEESKAVFPYVASLAHEYGARIKILHVLPPVLPLSARSAAETSKNCGALQKEIESIFRPQMSARCNAQFTVDFGLTVERILDNAALEKADLIALGVREAPGISTHLARSVAYRVVVEADCPVLTARHTAG